MEREKLSSRAGFIFLSAGCAIGIGNVWRFPYMTGKYGGGIFVFFYLLFLLIMGVPMLSMEFAMGRASGHSIIKSYKTLEKPGQKWHLLGYLGLAGNYVLMMFYTTVTGWMIYYFYQMITGRFEGKDTEYIQNAFPAMLEKPEALIGLMILVVVVGIVICSRGLQKGVENMSRMMMTVLLIIMILLAVQCVTMRGSLEGLKFYLIPDFERVKEMGILKIVTAAMGQAFFTLSLGIGSMSIFGSYTDKKYTLVGESVIVLALDTFVAIVSGLIIFPACFAFGIAPDSGPSLVFTTLPNVFNIMPGGRIWGSLFFVFMIFAAFTTVLAVFENVVSCGMDMLGWTRKRACLVNLVLMILLSLPCVFGFNLWKEFQPLGAGSTVLDLEDFAVSSVLLPIGALGCLLFCVTRLGWGFENFRQEANEGMGIRLPKGIRGYLTYVLPILLLILLLQGILG